MSSRDTYNSSVVAANPVKTATVTAAQATHQETINSVGVNVGYTLQTGNYANFSAGVKAANTAKFNTVFAAEQAKQAARDVARDTLRAAGDFGPA